MKKLLRSEYEIDELLKEAVKNQSLWDWTGKREQFCSLDYWFIESWNYLFSRKSHLVLAKGIEKYGKENLLNSLNKDFHKELFSKLIDFDDYEIVSDFVGAVICIRDYLNYHNKINVELVLRECDNTINILLIN